MKRGDLKMDILLWELLFVTALLVVMAMTAASLTVPAYADESTSISCYNEAKSSWPVGNVSVFDIAQAAQICNSMYYDCRGRCIGCYQDSDYIDNVCVDIRGNMFLK